jgi:hypothetical protein
MLALILGQAICRAFFEKRERLLLVTLKQLPDDFQCFRRWRSTLELLADAGFDQAIEHR